MNLEHLEKVKVLGEGTYGKCYLVNNTKQNELCVLKQIQISQMNESQVLETKKQATILKALDHPNIIKCIDTFVDGGTLNIVMDYAGGGDLSKKIKDAKGCQFSQNQVLNWFTQLCLAIKHVHDRKIIHRDLKSQNVFLTADNIVKLGDFGIAKPLQMTLQKIKTVVGTPYYMSPEICENKEYSLKTDIWSLGVILYETCALKPPFDANSLPALALKISRGQYGSLPSNYSKEIKRLISDLLQVDPIKRPNINDLLKSPLIKARIDNFLPCGIRQREFSHTTLHSHNIFQRDDIKKQISKLAKNNDTLHLNSIISPRSATGGSNIKNMFPVQTPQHKNLNNFFPKNYNSNNKQYKSGQNEKKFSSKKNQLRKRQVSQPSLTPKYSQRKLKGNSSMNNLEKAKKSDRERNSAQQCFKRKKMNENTIQSELLEIKQIKGQVLQIHQQLISQKSCKTRQDTNITKVTPRMINNFIKQQLEQSDNQDDDEYEQDENENEDEEHTSSSGSSSREAPSKKEDKEKRTNSNELSETLQNILVNLIGQKQLSKQYARIEENQGFIMDSSKVGKNYTPQPNQGLVSLLYGLNTLLI